MIENRLARKIELRNLRQDAKNARIKAKWLNNRVKYEAGYKAKVSSWNVKWNLRAEKLALKWDRRAERTATRVARRALKWQGKWRKREVSYASNWNRKLSGFDKKMVKWDKRAWKWGGRRTLFYPSIPRPQVVYV